ncbi:hypothetical protein [Sinisalibacter lacisalsi]|uniref:Uncharacterized protein n=1 Tax=Sinisalibacter lacisalsi TaxID=1526570 RepID=A0ABQ1QKF2_9RHOB|nr:hypothetical protein [Sinisalibacter lacisalsi]GGD28829.1 hypothetical protein GCM10011358_11130 [Sinisalibacter lacisalsi]
MTSTIKTRAIFAQSFELAGFDETLPAGEYEIETDLLELPDRIEPGDWTSSVRVRLHPRASHPGLARTLTVPLADLEQAVARDKLTGKTLTDFFLEEMLADPMIRLFMRADGVDEAEIRELYVGRTGKQTGVDDRTTGQGETTSGGRAPARTPAPPVSRPEIGE